MESKNNSLPETELFYRHFSQAVSENDFRKLHSMEKQSTSLPKEFLNSPIDDKAYTPLHYASSVGDVKMSEFLIEQGANVNMPDREGNTALLWAAKKGHLQVVISLVEKYKANVNMQNFASESALFLATCNNDGKMVSFLLENGASPNLANSTRETPLHLAAAFGYLNILDLLVRVGGAWLESEDEVGDTALHFAVREGQQQAVVWLLNHGADTNHANEDDETPRALARDLDDRAIIKILESMAGSSSDAVYGSDNDDDRRYELDFHLNLSGEMTKMSLDSQ